MVISHVRTGMKIISSGGKCIGSVGTPVRVAMVGCPTAGIQTVSVLACVNEGESQSTTFRN